MDCFTLLWMFDDRWLCRFRPPLYQQLLLGPILVNLAVLVATIYDKLQCNAGGAAILVDCLSVQATLLVVQLAMYWRLVKARRKVISKATQNEAKAPLINVDRVINFLREVQARRLIWGCYGMVVAALSVALFGLQLSYFISEGCQVYGLRGSVFVHMVFWGVIFFIVLAFLTIKLVYLWLAWRNSALYLRMRNVH